MTSSPSWLRRLCVLASACAATVLGASAGIVPVRWWVLGLGALFSLLFLSRSPRGILAMVAIVPFIAGIRRVAAGPEGYVASDPLILLPYVLVLGPLLVWILRCDRSSAPAPMAAVMVVLAVSAAVGLLRSPVGTAYAALGHALPLAVGMVVATQPAARLFHLVRRTIGWVAPAVVLYGLVQWLAPLPWDLAWLRGRQEVLVSIGAPVPGEFRLFGTMASQAPFAFFLALCLAHYLLEALGDPPGRRVLHLGLATATAVPLALTSVRSALFALPLALLVVLLVTRRIPVPVTLGVVALLTAAAVTLPVLLGGPSGPPGSSRYDVGSLSSDTSFQARAALLPQFVDVLRSPVGGGLGAATVDAPDSGGGGGNIDNGYLARGLEQGPAGVAVLVLVLWVTIRRGLGAVRARVQDADYALVVVLLFALFELSVPTISGTSGVFFWCAAGHLLGRGPAAPTSPEPAQVGPPLPRDRRRRNGADSGLVTARTSSA